MSQSPFGINCALTLVGTGSLEVIPDISGVAGVEKLEGRTDTANFVVHNGDGSNALTHFKVQIQVFRGGPYVDFLVDANWTVPDNNMLITTPVSTTAAGASSLVMIRTGPIHGIKFFAQGAAGIPVTIQGTIG